MRPDPTPRRGGAVALFVVSVVIGGAGLALDLTMSHGVAFWAGAQPGARALIGLAAGVVVAGAGRGVRALLARRDEGGRDARDHA